MPGETLFWFSGKVIDFAEAASRGEKEGNPLQVDRDRYIDVESPGLFLNHSCEPNAGLRDSVRLIALRRIKVGEEIRLDYSTELMERHWTMVCRCGSRQCRGLIVDFDLLPPAIREKRLRQKIVQPYIVQQLRLKKSRNEF